MESGEGARGRLGETLAMYLLVLPYAVFTTILGAILLELLSRFSMPLTEGGFFNAALNGGSFAGIVLSGFIIDRYDKRTQILTVFGLFIAALFVIHWWNDFWPFVFLLFFNGFVLKILDVLLNARLADLHKENRGFYMNLLHACFGTGCFLGPILAGTVLERGRPWTDAYLLLGFAALAAFAVYFHRVRKSPRAVDKSAGKAIRPPGFASVMNRRLGLLWLTLFFYCGHQIGINNWLPAYMTETFGYDALAAGSAVSTFWFGLILGRLSCSVLTRTRPERTLILCGLAAGGAALLAGVLAGSESMIFAAALLAGLFSGATIPMVLTVAYGWYPAEARGKVSMLLFLGISIGGVAFPWLMGRIEGVLGLKWAMAADALLLLAAFVVMLCTPKTDRPA